MRECSNKVENFSVLLYIFALINETEKHLRIESKIGFAKYDKISRAAPPTTTYTFQFQAPLSSLENKNIFDIYPTVRISLGTTRHSGATLFFPNLTNPVRIGPPPFKIHEITTG